jgi:hypothetical protein
LSPTHPFSNLNPEASINQAILILACLTKGILYKTPKAAYPPPYRRIIYERWRIDWHVKAPKQADIWSTINL